MTTLEGRPNTALLVIDAQNAILAERGEMPLSGIR
jgi:nicotinamidase-related amidase